MNTTHILKAITFLAVAVTLVHPANADQQRSPAAPLKRVDADWLIAARSASSASGLGRQSLPILRRLPGPGNEVAAQKVMNLLANAALLRDSVPTRQTKDGYLALSAADWSMHVSGSGDFVRWHARQRASQPSTANPVLSYEDTVARGRRYYQDLISKVVTIGPGEQVVPMGVSYRQQGALVSDGMSNVEVTHYRVRFTRVVNGVPMVGSGSRVVIEFDTAGRLTGFDLDWSTLEVTDQMQAIVPIKGVRTRFESLLAGNPVDLSSADPSLEPLCGYVDPGAAGSSKTQHVQPGCVFEVKRPGSGVVQYAIPAGESFVADVGWHETVMLSSKK